MPISLSMYNLSEGHSKCPSKMLPVHNQHTRVLCLFHLYSHSITCFPLTMVSKLNFGYKMSLELVVYLHKGIDFRIWKNASLLFSSCKLHKQLCEMNMKHICLDYLTCQIIFSFEYLFFVNSSLLILYFETAWVHHKRCNPVHIIQKTDFDIPCFVPTPWHWAEKSSVSLTVNSPMCRSYWLMYADVFWGTNSCKSCPLYETRPFIYMIKTNKLL